MRGRAKQKPSASAASTRWQQHGCGKWLHALSTGDQNVEHGVTKAFARDGSSILVPAEEEKLSLDNYGKDAAPRCLSDSPTVQIQVQQILFLLLLLRLLPLILPLINHVIRKVVENLNRVAHLLAHFREPLRPRPERIAPARGEVVLGEIERDGEGYLGIRVGREAVNVLTEGFTRRIT